MVVAALVRAGRCLRRPDDRHPVFGAYGEAHPRQISDQIPANSAAAHTPEAALLLVAVASLVLVVRNRWPLAVLGVSVAAVTVYSALGYVNGAALLAPVVAVYTVATKDTPPRAIGWAALATAVLMTATGLHNPFGPTGAGFYLIPGLVAAACLGGIAVARRRAYVVSIEARAGQDAQRRIDEERLRIARDLHDVVAHTMATINVQPARPRTWPPNARRWRWKRCRRSRRRARMASGNCARS